MDNGRPALASKVKVEQEIPNKSGFERLADESGLAIAVVDSSSREISVANNNSICRNLNPEGIFTTHCKAFCGTAFEETMEVGAVVSYTCHAGLECRAVPLRGRSTPLVAIIGRTFVKAENYRHATTRAISGDWKDHSPAEFFENILLSGSVSALDRAVKKIENMPSEVIPVDRKAPLEIVSTADVKQQAERVNPRPSTKTSWSEVPENKPSPSVSNVVERFNREVGLTPKFAKPTLVKVPGVSQSERSPEPELLQKAEPPQVPEAHPNAVIDDESAANEERPAGARAWRSFFGSLLKTDYFKAADSILEFVALQYDLSSLIWLEKNEERLQSAAAFGEAKHRKIRLGIAADDKRLIAALQDELPLVLAERKKDASGGGERTMYLFPIGIADDISAGIAVIDQITDEKTKRQIARFCHSIAPQLEILRLRSEVARSETITAGVRRFSQSLKQIDAEDLWLKLTQNAAEMLHAERASLLIYDEKAKTLEIKAMIGPMGDRGENDVIGSRVARVVFEKNRPIIVPDVSKTGLPPAARKYKTPSFMSCPLAIGGRSIGVMSFTDKASGQPFDRSSLVLFQAIAPQLAVAIDRASLKEKAGAYQQLSVTDSLTGLVNRRYIDERLLEEVKRSNRHGFPMGFMMIDVDHFKSYNDEFGHLAGDSALKLVGQVIRETLRAADVASRWGGEEFSILLPQTTGSEAAAIAERIRSNIEAANFGHRRVTISIGIASCSAELCSSENIVAAADKALYEAKRRGRNGVVAFEQM